MYDLPLRGIYELRGGQSSIQEKRTREDALCLPSYINFTSYIVPSYINITSNIVPSYINCTSYIVPSYIFWRFFAFYLRI